MIKRNLPLMITIGVFVLGYIYCLTQFPGFASTRVICNILTDNAFLGIIAVGMTFVILSGGIDLSVGSVIAFTGVFLAKVIGDFGLSPLLAFPLVLVMGCAFGAFMGLLIDALKIPAFIITLAGMFFLRGVSYLVSEESIPINHPVYDTLSSLAWKIPGGGRLSAMGLLMLAVVVIGIFLAHRTRFGNQVYAIGGNATSANLMGISTCSTTIRIYMLSTGLATLAGIVFSIYTQAGYALAGVGVELDAIAWERGTANVQPSSKHRNSDVVLIILTAHAGEDALAQVKKCRHYQSYLWGFHGWSNYRLIVAELSSGRIVHNRHGQILKKLVKKAMIN